MTETTAPDGQRVALGQIWADNDWRSKGRTIRIVGICSNHVLVETVTGVGGKLAPKRQPTRILLNRLRPISTGYRLLSNPE
ncbi:MAG: hypothetical protein PHQ28_00400 [Mycobacterium sp.]|nr:hypothetical protein [Mycobacterium sp.]